MKQHIVSGSCTSLKISGMPRARSWHLTYRQHIVHKQPEVACCKSALPQSADGRREEQQQPDVI